jgi:hypothetical protein
MKKGLKEPSQIAYHSDTQSSQKTCLQRSEIGACIFSWQIAHISPAASTCISPTIADFHYFCVFPQDGFPELTDRP